MKGVTGQAGMTQCGDFMLIDLEGRVEKSLLFRQRMLK